jgi:uncharacterized protein YrrD
MTVLLKAADLVKRPVVTLAGDDVAQIKDVIYQSQTGELAGFTLNGRGLFSGPLRKTLPWENVHGLGPAAVMIRDESSLADRKALRGETEGAGGSVLGSTVITQSGRNLGVVTDVILAVGDTMTDAVGYEIDPTDASAPRRQFVPLPDTLAVSGEALMLPDAATEFIRDDLAGFGAAVDEFRSRLRGHAAAGGRAPSPAAPETTVAPESTVAPEGTATPRTTVVPESSAAPQSSAPAQSSAAPQSSAPAQSSAAPETTIRPVTEPGAPAEPATPPPDRVPTEKLPVDEPTRGEQR